MSAQTIEQKMGIAAPWNGAAPSGGLSRQIVHDVADNVVAATKVWTFTNGAFTAADVDRLLLMGGTASGNDGIFTIALVNSPTEIETVEAPALDETFGASVTQDIYEAVGVPVIANDMTSHPEGAAGGLFDFANTNPLEVVQIFIKPGVGTTSWALSVVDVDAVEAVLYSAANADPFLSLSGMLLLQGQKLKLTSVGLTTAASRARISAHQFRR